MELFEIMLMPTGLEPIIAALEEEGFDRSLAAALSGKITGLAIARRLGLMEDSARDIVTEEERVRRFIDAAIRPFLDRYYPAPKWIGAAADDVRGVRREL